MAAVSRAFSSGRARASSAGLVLATLLLAACGGEAQIPPHAPKGAVHINDGLYAVPIPGRDEDGCEAWRLWSPDRMVDQALRYRRADGRFVMNKLEAACMDGKPNKLNSSRPVITFPRSVPEKRTASGSGQ
ncbi:MAG: hypothetical protein Kow00104_01840 [Rhodothalassiaceae bacterium]